MKFLQLALRKTSQWLAHLFRYLSGLLRPREEADGRRKGSGKACLPGLRRRGRRMGIAVLLCHKDIRSRLGIGCPDPATFLSSASPGHNYSASCIVFPSVERFREPTATIKLSQVPSLNCFIQRGKNVPSPSYSCWVLSARAWSLGICKPVCT